MLRGLYIRPVFILILMNRVLVSVCCITYNHSKYIEECLDGFLIQKCDFDLEFLIHDDASTDDTQEIIRNKVGSDSRFKLYFRSENLKSTGKAIFPILFKEAKGKYIAMCEGDDYWTDSYKLQKQVEFLEKNEDYILTYHNIDTNTLKISALQTKHNFEFSLKDSLNLKQGATLSGVFRNIFRERSLPFFYSKLHSGDWGLEIVLMTMGKGYYIGESMGYYRSLPEGLSESKKFKSKKEKAKWLFIWNMLFWSPKNILKFSTFLVKRLVWRFPKLKYFSSNFIIRKIELFR